MLRNVRALALGLALALGVAVPLTAPAQDHHDVRPVRRPHRRHRAPTPVQAAAPVAAEHGPTPGCPGDCYSFCGGGAHVDPNAPPTERQIRCRGCRNICADTGHWPPSAAH